MENNILSMFLKCYISKNLHNNNAFEYHVYIYIT